MAFARSSRGRVSLLEALEVAILLFLGCGSLDQASRRSTEVQAQIVRASFDLTLSVGSEPGDAARSNS
jgi:hypothetical protein